MPSLLKRVPSSSNPVPSLRKLAPCSSNPVPSLRKLAPSSSNPVPSLRNPVPSWSDSVPSLGWRVTCLMFPVPGSRNPVCFWWSCGRSFSSGVRRLGPRGRFGQVLWAPAAAFCPQPAAPVEQASRRKSSFCHELLRRQPARFPLPDSFTPLLSRLLLHESQHKASRPSCQPRDWSNGYVVHGRSSYCALSIITAPDHPGALVVTHCSYLKSPVCPWEIIFRNVICIEIETLV